MRRSLVAVCLVVACTSLLGAVGCDKLLKRGADGDADASAASSASAAAATATPSAAPAKPTFANNADITRYPDEKAFADEKASVHTNMLARVSVPSGAVVATVLAGKPVTKIASHAGFVLVSFDDPKDASRTLLGWMAQGGISAAGATPATPGATAAATGRPADAGAKAAPCPAGQARFVGMGCKVECPTDDICKKVPGTECVGGQFLDDGQGVANGRACLPVSKTPAKKCKPGEILAADECALKCNPDAPKCPAGKKCEGARFRGETGDFVFETICQ